MPEPVLAQTHTPHQSVEPPVRPGAGLNSFLARQRWFGFRGRTLRDVGIGACIRLAENSDVPCILGVDVEAGAERMRYQLPATKADPASGQTCLAWLGTPDGRRPLRDASNDTTFWQALVRYGQRQGTISGTMPARSVQLFSGEQSNSVAFVDNRYCIKLYRSVGAGPGTETEMLRYLNGAGYRHAPRLMGVICNGAEPLAVATAVLPDSEDAWSLALRSCRKFLVQEHAWQANGQSPAPLLPVLARDIGRRVAAFHRVMAEASGTGLAPVPFTQSDAMLLLQEVAADLSAARKQQNTGIADKTWEYGLAALRTLSVSTGGLRIRTHGDLHLGQILVSRGEIFLTDFEGAPGRRSSSSGRRHPALRDLAGILRSLEYVALAACDPEPGDLVPRALHLADLSQAACLAAYREAGALEPSGWRPLLWVLMLQRALHELRYERGHRPAWAHLALRGLSRLLERGPSSFIRNLSE